MKKRVLSLVLAFLLCTSLMVAPARAAVTPALPGVVTTPAQSVLGLSNLKPLVESLKRAADQISADSTLVAGSYWTDGNPVGYVYCTYDSMCALASALNTEFNDNYWFFYVTKLSDSDFYAIRLFRMSINNNPTSALWYLADHEGYMLVSIPGDGVPGASTIPDYEVKSISTSSALATGAYKMLSYEDLYNLTYEYNQGLASPYYSLVLNLDGVYWAKHRNSNYVLANESGLPYGAVGPSSVTSGGSRPDVTTNEDHIIDWLNNTVGSNDGVYGFDNVLYDSNNKTYYVDNSTSYQNSFNETYYYNWSYTYNIDYTSITYIGSSAEYTETYECYYELPDGRSSADLTKEDLEQLNLSMDVVPYIRSSDDTRLRSLYHFDGNTEDASYWNYATSFDWTSGASLTYLESNAFNGCLYLDELTHDFTITLPSSLGSGDFTVDFRYYQSSTIAPQNDSYIKIGGQEVLRLDGSHFIFNGSNYSTPVGNWNHLAFVRKDGTLYFYLNGVRQGSKVLSSALSSEIQFYFGTSQQTYKYLDELRVTNFAVWDSNFTPPTVPYDTNLSLVLPTDSVPIADEYWDIQCENNLLSQYNLDWWDSLHTSSGIYSSYFLGADYRSSYDSHGYYAGFPFGYFLNYTDRQYSYPYFAFDNSKTSFFVSDLGSSFTSGYATYSDYLVYSILNRNTLPFGADLGVPYFGLTTLVAYNNSSTYGIRSCNSYSSMSNKLLSSGSYTLSLVLFDGTIVSLTFSIEYNGTRGVVSSSSSHGYTVSTVVCDGKNPEYGGNTSGSSVFVNLSCDNSAVPFLYLALEQGSQSTVTAEFVSGVAGIPADDLNTPTLAVRSDIAINNKQIGGVRPSFAQRGDVYAMVESGFITSLQQYTGYAWQQVDGRIWTGSRWIPYSSYNVITLSDMYDIADASGQSGYEYIYSQSGFWSWWQKQWLEFKQWYSTLSFTGGGGDTVVEGDTINNDYDVDIDFGTARSNSVGLLQFIQTIFGDITSGFANFTSLYTSPDDSLDVLFPAEQTNE